MLVKIYTGSLPSLAASIEAKLLLINGVETSFINNRPDPDERGMTPIVPVKICVNGKSFSGYSAIQKWLEREHNNRVAEKHTRQLQKLSSVAVL